MRKFICPKCVLFLVFTLVFHLAGCGGGGGGGDGGGDESGDSQTPLESTLNAQNAAAEEHFTKLQEFARALFTLEDDMAAVSPTDERAQEECCTHGGRTPDSPRRGGTRSRK